MYALLLCEFERFWGLVTFDMRTNAVNSCWRWALVKKIEKKPGVQAGLMS